MNPTKKLRILGIRGLPAKHGGFETFAHYLAPYLVQNGWEVIVYCQEEGKGEIYQDNWQGVQLIHIPVEKPGAAGTIIFDWRSIKHACKEDGLVLTLGYNTAIFSIWYRLKGIKNVINMDGIEWRRQKWGAVAKTWFYLNEWAGAWLGNHLVADHPSIKSHLATRVKAEKITTIAYGAKLIEDANATVLSQFGLAPYQYAIVIARAEPENSILQIVRAWSRRMRGYKLVVLGNYRDDHAYQAAVKQAASAEVVFPGAIYEAEKIDALRFFSRLYIHGHQVGGTNPSLVEALGAGSPILAHANPFNKWVVGEDAQFFENEESCAGILDVLLDDESQLQQMRRSSLTRFGEGFTWGAILAEYAVLLASQFQDTPYRIQTEPPSLNPSDAETEKT
jgi:glycosyltransferase involved in cell wall biosynthesis